MDEAPDKFPPEEWFTAMSDGRQQRVSFRDNNGDTEFVKAVWIEANIFGLRQQPLLVDGVCIDDDVEVEWREGSVEPHYLRNLPEVADEWSYRVIRSHPTPREVREFRHLCKRLRLNCFGQFRYERGIFVVAISLRLIRYLEEEEEIRLSSLLPGKWRFTDTGTQE
ncbi:MAG: hypothetical protein QOH49_4364 [Acidobacteriota bacterium]|jgi:hypothetical protein|nr:hypothetical protein [Acidobacteriota bacterium]